MSANHACLLPFCLLFLAVFGETCFSPPSCQVAAVYFYHSAALIWTCISLSLQAVGTPLLPHQKQALSWMCARENKSALPPFWEKRGELYYNSLTCFSAKEIPERVRGGILADDMGLVSNTHTHKYTHISHISACTHTKCITFILLCDAISLPLKQIFIGESDLELLFVFSREKLWQPSLWSSPTSTKESLCLWRNV